MTDAREAEVGEMEAGGALDLLVAERVRGAVWRDCQGGGRLLHITLPDGRTFVEGANFEGRDRFIGESYSASIDAAWDVVEEMRRRGFNADIWNLAAGPDAGWRCRFSNDDGMWTENGSTSPLSICRAALAALRSLSPNTGDPR